MKSPATIAPGRLLMLEAVAGRCGQGERRVGEAAVAVAAQDGEAVRALIDDHDIVAAVAGEVSRDQADRLREGADGRTGRGRARGRKGPCSRGIATTG